jgi:hypothetical protein
MSGTQGIASDRDCPIDLITGCRPFELYNYGELFARAEEIGLPEDQINSWAEELRFANKTQRDFEEFLNQFELERDLEAQRT